MAASTDLDVFACPLDGIHLVEASAGTGKTWNICGLYLRLLLERGLAVESLLVVTFTKAATAELSTRIRDRIVDTLRVLDGGAAGGDPFVPQLIARVEQTGIARAEMSKRLRHALQTFDEAAIFTIHSFCQRALADSPFAAGLPYALQLAEDDSALRLEVAQDFWRRAIIGGALPAALADLLAQNGDCPETWAETLKADMAKPLAERRWDAEVLATDPTAAGAALDAAGAELARAYAEAAACWQGDGAQVLARVNDAAASLNKNSYKPEAVARAQRQWADWFATGDARAPLPADKDSKLGLLCAATLAEKTNKGGSTPGHAFCDAADTLLAARAALDGQLESARLALLRGFLDEAAAELRRRKREQRQIAFDDILWNAYEALAGGRQPWLAAALHARFPAALIDEFQDTDPLQFAIFDRIYRGEGRHGSLFLVGDPKQAIYSFRSADLHTYLAARERADSRYTLRRNQRSAPALIEACNRLFGANGRVFMLPGLDYERVEAGERPRPPLVDLTASAGPAALRLWRIPKDEALEGEEGGDRLPRGVALQRAAAASAAEIARLLAAAAAGEVRIGERPLAPADIAVLVRSHGQGARMRQALAAVGVGSVELSQASVFHTEDAEELERILLAIAEPARQPRVLAALAGAAMGRDAAALARLAGDEAALLDILDRFARWRDTWLARGFGVMLRQWMADERVAARLLARADGERRLTNLMHLAELLQQAAGEASPEVLLRALASRRADSGGGEAAQLRLESDRNLVQIVTIHRSKGLEYGIVFCPFLFDGYPGRDDGGAMRSWHEDDGRLVLDYRRRSTLAAEEDKDILARQKLERQAEDLRLVYVALTRAVYRCYLVVGCYATLSFGRPSYSESGRSLLNWMVAGGGLDTTAWREHKMTPAEIDARWRQLVAAAQRSGEPTMALADLPDGAAVALPPPDHGDASPRALRPPPIPAGWRIGSFSALIFGATHEQAAQDHDARTLAPEEGEGEEAGEGLEAAPALAADDILRFPRGPAAGDCLHAVFERIDFTDERGWDAAIAAALQAHPQRLAGVSEEESARRLPRMLRRLLADVIAAPLGEGLQLAQLPLSRRLTELAFHLPAPALDAAGLNRWLAAQGYGVPRLAFAGLAGYLKGFIDLVFEHQGRFYLLDWKSNHLGDRPQDYAGPRLEAAMQAHGYHLQHLLYTVALHRHLGLSLPGYDYERHFGGTRYLFVRGVRPGWEVAGAEGPRPAGVYSHRPALAVVQELDALLAGRQPAERGLGVLA
ncbi:exodeoxyribonuclease V subunit beta [Azoarcus indigens]|uniref:RecBCD enzyme subunit RecB n=1 Tax=Azoarcus indigens TaxID=29545 RepID=A0A4R6DM34_9RHOO|nr:exodeoxyribonuclease V subunit beta [Azoarcus indigens]NMG66135.1 exodeoxyribonuclease V subunit beta [Azoarcus indigens]TDN45554.1 DNA helicase/exodeoxyribonuclease V beta subunit [Azoarcus indigens]